MKVLVTGSHGTLGRAFIEYLQERAIPFCRYDRQHPERTEQDFDAVVNFAGLTAHSKGARPVRDPYRAVNVEGTERILSFIATNPRFKRLVHIGTSAEYGFSKKRFTERSAPRPANEYGESKLAQTRLIERFSRTHAVKTFNLRVFNLLGAPRRPAGGRRFIDEHVLSQLSHNAKVAEVSHVRDVRDYIALHDMFDAILAALKSNKGSRYELINICSGRGTSVSQLVHALERETNRTISLKSTKHAATRNVGDPSKARRVLGWKAQKGLAGIVRDSLQDRRVLIVGAGAATELVLKELEKDVEAGMLATGIVDDDRSKRGKRVRGVRVLGAIRDIPRLTATRSFDRILIAVPSEGPRVAARVAELAPRGMPVRVLPSIASVMLGKVDLANVRDIDPSDLIGRPLVKTDQERIAKRAAGKTFLVTGGAGSIGGELVRQLKGGRARRIIVLDSSEEAVFRLSQEVAGRRGTPELIFKLGNIRDKSRLEEIAREYPIDVIIHAAAYKHVPLLEENPDEARKTNERGTKNLLDLAQKYRIPDFLLISTDKAVNPASVLGRTKRAAELLVQRYAKEHGGNGTRFMAVRFGNVLNSSGSMLPTFLRQIRERVPLTITHKDVTRYLMSIPEAVSLVLMSWVVGKNGQLLLLDMGEPVNILDLAEKLVRLHGLVPYEDIPIVEIGLRAGEKLHEELSYDASRMRPSPAAGIFIAEDIDRR